MAALAAQLAESREVHDALQADLAAERQAHAATQARLEAGRAELDAAGRQLAELRTQFSTELERAREQVTLAQERAEASERRSLRELDAERTARQKSDRTAEELRGELVAARSEARDAMQAELGAAQRRAERAEAEAALARQLLAELRVAPPGRGEGGGGRRRKAGAPAPTEQDAPGETPDEPQDDNQGAPTAASHPDDSNDSTDDRNQ